ncbi:MAG: SHOCT domain-containing protein [Mycobacterium sp.]
MNPARMASRIAMVVSILTLVVAVAGFVVMLILNAFVLGNYNVYGEVPIPGSGNVHLPAGEVTVNFHTEVIGSPRGGGLPIPRLKMGIDPPPGVPEPVVTESIGNTTTVNNDSHVRVWLLRVPADATYHITTDGQVGGFISPRLAFGHESPYGWATWSFVGLFVTGLVSLTGSAVWMKRTRSSMRPVATAEQPIFSQLPADSEMPTAAPEQPLWSYTAETVPPPSSYTSDEEAIKLDQLKTLTALRDSGALTDAEFRAEKRRVLDGR